MNFNFCTISSIFFRAFYINFKIHLLLPKKFLSTLCCPKVQMATQCFHSQTADNLHKRRAPRFSPFSQKETPIGVGWGKIWKAFRPYVTLAVVAVFTPSYMWQEQTPPLHLKKYFLKTVGGNISTHFVSCVKFRMTANLIDLCLCFPSVADFRWRIWLF